MSLETGPGEAYSSPVSPKPAGALVSQSSVRAKVIQMSHTCLKPSQEGAMKGNLVMESSLDPATGR